MTGRAPFGQGYDETSAADDVPFGDVSASEARAFLCGLPDAERYLAVTEPLRLGRSQVRFIDPSLGVLTEMMRDSCYYAVPFNEEGAAQLGSLVPAGAVVNVCDIAYAPLVAPGGDPTPYNFWVYRDTAGCEDLELDRQDGDPLEIRQLDPADFDAVAARYHLISEDAILDHLKRGWLYGGYDASGKLIGFIGEHDEASMGMLEVFPEARRHGYARKLESHLARLLRSQGRAVYCHVKPDNAASIALQRRLGLRPVGPTQCWVEKPQPGAIR